MNEHDPRQDADLAPEDDAVIAVAFRRSLVTIAILALLVGGVWIAQQISDPEPVDVVVEQPLEAPSALQEVLVPAAQFVDATEPSGISFHHRNGAYGERLLPETMGGGVAFLDFDRDGDQDLALASSNAWPWDETTSALEQTVALYRNDGSGRFDRVDSELGPHTDAYAMGLAVADYDGDGYPDLFLSTVGTNRLFRNRAGEGFEEVTAIAGLDDQDSWSSGAAFFDYDGDGWLDLAVADYVGWDPDMDRSVGYQLTGIGRAYGPPTNFPGTQVRLYRNQGDGQFSKVGETAGLQVLNPASGQPVAKALAVLPVDLQGDGWVDLVVANDTTRNFAFVNQGDGTFEEQGQALGLAFDNTGKATGAMGIDWAWPTDGEELVIAVGNFANEMTSFYATRPEFGVFSDDAVVHGIGPTSRKALTFGLFFFDFDLDGRLDFFQVNGHVENEINRVQPSQHYEQSAQLFWNCGLDCPRTFQPVESIGDLSQPMVGRGTAYGDVDGDGDLDIVVGQTGRPFRLFRNDTSGGNWLRIQLDDSGTNRFGIGALVEIQVGTERQRRSVQPARSYLSSVEIPVTFGLGESTQIDRVEVTWPDGQVQSLGPVEGNQVLTISRSTR